MWKCSHLWCRVCASLQEYHQFFMLSGLSIWWDAHLNTHMMVEYTCYLTDILDYWVTQQICISMCICSCLTIVFTKNTVKHLSLYTLERHNCGGREELQWSWKRVYMPRNKGSSQNVIQQQVGSLDTYTFAWVSAVSNHISPKFYDVNHINYVLQCAKTFYAFSFCQWTLI